MKSIGLLIFSVIFLISCKKEGCMDVTANNFNPDAEKDDGSCTYTVIPYEPNLILIIDFDSTQVRLDNFGQPATMPSGHAGQSPKINAMGSHYIELAPSALTQLGSGEILYHAAETTLGGENAIDFDKSKAVGKGVVFMTIPIKDITPGLYEYLRVSLSYQNYDVKFHYDSIHTYMGNNYHIIQDFPATVASFVGFNSYITSYMIKTQTINVNANKKQGYWGFEASGIIPELNNYPFLYVNTGQAPAGATTVPNPISSTSPIPAGSCVVTGAFYNGTKLNITGNETEDITIRISLSTNKSFEWIDGNGNGLWEPNKGEQIVDMGLRGMIPYIE